MGELDATSDPDRLGLAAQLAETAGDGDRAFALRLTSSRAALRVGAVASARDAATDALRLARTPEGVVDARRALLDAGVAAADSARIIPLGTQLLDQLVALGAAEEDLAEIHHLMAAAAVTRSDWCQAAAGLDAADRCAPSPPAAITARHEALRAEVALGEHRIEAALAYAERARTAAVRAGRHDLEADALALLGRSSRLSDLGAAERWFTAALGAAELSGSALRRATALHELATIDVIGLGCTDRVRHARSLAAGIGAPGRVVRAGALEELARAVALAPPDSATARSPLRGLHALLLAVEDARGAEDVATELAHTPVLDAVAAHYGTLARAVLAGRSADDTSAMMHFATADAGLTGAPWLRRLGRRLVAETAITDGWGDPSTWLHDAHAFFSSSAPDVARACRSLLRHSGSPLPRDPDAVPPALAARGITLREADVLVLLARGLSNREIAARLRLSPRTVEKHVERLMGKTGTTRRTQLVALMTGLTGAQ